MTRQANSARLCPRLHIVQTSDTGYGQMHYRLCNWTFRPSRSVSRWLQIVDSLAAAFGIAVSLTMLLTSMLIFLTMREYGPGGGLTVAGLFVIVDLAFVSAK